MPCACTNEDNLLQRQRFICVRKRLRDYNGFRVLF